MHIRDHSIPNNQMKYLIHTNEQEQVCFTIVTEAWTWGTLALQSTEEKLFTRTQTSKSTLNGHFIFTRTFGDWQLGGTTSFPSQSLTSRIWIFLPCISASLRMLSHTSSLTPHGSHYSRYQQLCVALSWGVYPPSPPQLRSWHERTETHGHSSPNEKKEEGIIIQVSKNFPVPNDTEHTNGFRHNTWDPGFWLCV